jgi:hypothetical protein
MLLGLDFMPPYQIVNMTLNGLRRGDVNHNKTIKINQMDEPSIELYQ